MIIQRSPWICGMSTQKLTNEQTTMLREEVSNLRKLWGNTIPTSPSSWLCNMMLPSYHHITKIIDDSLLFDKCNNSVFCTINDIFAFKKCFAQVFYGIFSISNN